MKRILFAALAMTLLCTGIAWATSSTLIWIPATDIQPAGVGHLDYDVYVPATGNMLSDVGLLYGSGTVEYGVDYLFQNGLVGNAVRLNAKALLTNETSTAPKAVFGVFDVGGGASNQIYILGSKNYDFGRLHLGYSIGNSSVLGSDNAMLLAGYDKQVSEKWWVCADFQSGRSAFGALNVGVAYSLSPSTSYIIGYDFFNNSDNAGFPNAITGQLDMNF